MEADERPSARADLVSSSIWIVIGAAIAVGSWRMDRLESMGVQPFAAPGLVPGILGLCIAATGLIIAVRSARAVARGDRHQQAESVGLGRAVLTLMLCLGFAAGLVGHGLPFWAAAAVYLFLHVFLLQYDERRAQGTVRQGVMLAAGVAIGVSAFVTIVFQYVFLVRLP
jgi:hypothetical protein